LDQQRLWFLENYVHHGGVGEITGDSFCRSAYGEFASLGKLASLSRFVQFTTLKFAETIHFERNNRFTGFVKSRAVSTCTLVREAMETFKKS
jgi:hypothetical protein